MERSSGTADLKRSGVSVAGKPKRVEEHINQIGPDCNVGISTLADEESVQRSAQPR